MSDHLAIFFNAAFLHCLEKIVKGTNVFKNLFFSCCGCVGHSSLSCGNLICVLSICKSFKTCILSDDYGKALQRFSLFNRYIPI